VHVSRDYGVFGRARDRRVAEAVGRGGARFVEHPGVLVHEPEEVVKDDGTPFAVFTPFRRRWDGVPVRAALPAPAKVRIPSELAVGEMPDPGARAPGIEAGEGKARQRLAEWVESDGVRGYRERRDFVGEEGTSRLSAALRWGLVSPVEVLELAAGDGEGAATFRSEVCWRDFYAHTLWWHPRVLQEPYQRQHPGIAWRQDAEGLAAWKAGRTGYPIVDAGMRELVATGWMHNRARMIVASFLSKDLLVDWREGEAFFMEHLVDGDPASNGGGWQWAASVGTDAQPYFRVFNPVLQGKKFDPDGTYVRRWIPELRGVPERYLHEPWAMPSMLQREVGCVIGADYPAPVVDHQAARTRAIAAFRA
ncbi:MAG: cryptochrome/photolyase family protein, partial [Tepidiformaceae bacterium]